MAWTIGAAGFLLPLGVLRALPRPSTPTQIVYVPAGSGVVLQPGSGGRGVKVLSTGRSGANTATTAPVTRTGGSHPIP